MMDAQQKFAWLSYAGREQKILRERKQNGEKVHQQSASEVLYQKFFHFTTSAGECVNSGGISFMPSRASCCNGKCLLLIEISFTGR
jgi:hypothetical protein